MKRSANDQWLTPASKKGKGGPKGGGKTVVRPHLASGGKGGGSYWDAGVPVTTYAFKALVTDSLAAALLGGGGSVKDTIQQETGVKLVFSNRNDYYPHSHYRVLGIYSDSEHTLVRAYEHIVAKVAEVADEEARNPPPHGCDLLGKEPGEYVFRFCITRKMCTLVIGNGGQTVSSIRQESGAKVFIDNETWAGHRSGRIIGGKDSVLRALTMVSELVQRDCQDPTFTDFAKIINFGDKDYSQLDELFLDPMGLDTWKGGKSGGKDRGKGGKGKSPAPWESQSNSHTSPPSPPVPVPPKGKGKGGAHSSPAASASYVPPRHGGKGSPSPASGHADTPVVVAARNRSVTEPEAPQNSENGGGEVGGSGGGAPVEDVIARLSEELSLFPEGTIDVPYSVDCELPIAQLEVMQSDADGPSYFTQVKEATAAEINLSESAPTQDEEGEEIQRLSVVGALPNIYAAHAMLMLRSQQLYLEWYSEDAAAEEVKQEDDPEALKARILELQEMLKKANKG
eukprot:CAMPEP_0206503874 /NCGR_PEP_ID=MMETSP0324_2-20121206/55061_1 /ASSEMBLY_ACC=CAM_ASM_000836 /TAXON_ID=2866 /ORGANISM="Crypthecodinium cohnii, Strain Seligo" /LENGTH=510 /DNA_ID=CAMNT_0053992759 /DNA_START=60 /DNA_END=1592 /DNA_ORIENTATION=+